MEWNLANSKFFTDTTKIGTEKSVEIILHEIFHALGFMNPMWQYFLDPLTGEKYKYPISD
jgi:hypothetical protein